jgi:hypothetical protein
MFFGRVYVPKIVHLVCLYNWNCLVSRPYRRLTHTMIQVPLHYACLVYNTVCTFHRNPTCQGEVKHEEHTSAICIA